MTTANTSTIGEQLAASPALTAAIDTIVAEVQAKSAHITDAKGPDADKVESYDALMHRAAQVRGKGLLYPYIGSGAGNGALVELLDGSVKWDMITGIGVHFFGHSEPGMVRAAVEGGFANTLKHGNLVSNFDAFEFGEVLLAEAAKGSRLKHAFVSTGGALANENALKVCMQKHESAPRVLAFADCFMGRTITMAQIGDSPGNRQGIPLSTLVDYMPFYDHVAAERMGAKRYIDMSVWHLTQYLDRYPNQHSCFIFELVQGEGGFNTATRDYFKALMDVCRDRNVAIWDDEIQSWGRTTEMFAYDMLDLGDYVDVFCVGKMSQACATLYTDEYNPKPGLLSGTFTGESATFRAGTCVIERLRDGNYYGESGLIAQHHAEFRKQVRALADKHPDWFPPVKGAFGKPGAEDIVGGVGGMMRFTPFAGAKDKIIKVCKESFHEGVILFWCGHDPYHVRMLPPLGVMKLEDWPRVFECIERALAKAAA